MLNRFISLLLIISLSTSLFAQTFYLNNGSEIIGNIIEEDEDKYIIEREDNNVWETVSKKDIQNYSENIEQSIFQKSETANNPNALKIILGIISFVAGGALIADGVTKVKVKTGEVTVQEAEWFAMTYESHYIYNGASLVTQWHFDYIDPNRYTSTYQGFENLRDYGYDTYGYWHDDYYTINHHIRYRQDSVFEERQKSETEIYGGIALIGLAVYLFVESSPKKNQLALKFNNNIQEPKVLLSYKF